ncbi:hypothetical protein O4N82_22960 [Vibrio parahaemolyticus]|uniref:hypothetical protein n=1 Tax=Vibrio parahaemolyticus TaxID=670 RepID=UPI00186A2B97|nr:hypothetical protein [Vibrio parahaemolyticus]EJR0682665.1 hypothetical protein [Vibrio parahaemolyticus]MBE3924360.1 hypothetical protein [Vibrio parahaemolyticus]MCZ6404575.1 hypothetical protein [Vibrio parahaemolyticus]
MFKSLDSYKPLVPHALPNDEETPMIYFYNSMGKLGHIQRELDWKMFDFCRLQHITYNYILGREKAMDEYAEKNKEYLQSANDQSMEGLIAVRQREAMMGETASNWQTFQFSNQMIVVGLWALAEQTLGFVYKSMYSQINNVQESSVKVPYKFDDFKKKFNLMGINIEQLDTYQDADECRTLNNTIKHGHLIEGHIVQFDYFIQHQGKRILDVEFELQRYVKGVVQFLSSLIEQGNQILDPSHPKN